MRKLLLFTPLLFLSYILAAQTNKLIDVSGNTTCEKAYELNAIGTFGPTQPPQSTGVLVFGRKEYVVWHKILIEKSGRLVFDIVPLDTLDNFDFTIYAGGSSGICKDITSETAPMLRSNYSRLDILNKGRTGLSAIGDEIAYSKAIDVKKDEVYYLRISNLSDERQGYSLVFNYLDIYIVQGIVTGKDTKKELKGAELTCTNMRTGEVIGRSETNKKGEYALEIGISRESHTFPKYNITAYMDKYFLEDTIIPSKNISYLEKSNLDFNLDKLKRDAKFADNIYFTPNSPTSILEPNSYDKLDKLYRLLKINDKIVIRLEGHSNGFFPSTDVDQQLSEARAKTVKDYLIKQGIEESRIVMLGHGCNKMMYPFPMDEVEESYNRRVEIFIEKLK